MYVLLICFIFLTECFAQDTTSKSSGRSRIMPSLVEIIENQLLHYHYELEATGENADEYFAQYQKLNEEKEIPDRIKILLARCIITSHDVEKINTFNKNVPTQAYPRLAYDVFLNQKLNSTHQMMIVGFMRDLPKKLERKPYQILDALIEYYNPATHYTNNRLLFACQNTIEPCIFKFLLKMGDQPLDLVIWHLTGDRKAFPEIHDHMLKKLEFLTNLPINVLLSPPNPFRKHIPLTPLEHAQAMLACWQDQHWIKGFYSKTFEQCENFRPILYEIPTPETIEKHTEFYIRVIELLKNSKNIMPQPIVLSKLQRNWPDHNKLQS